MTTRCPSVCQNGNRLILISFLDRGQRKSAEYSPSDSWWYHNSQPGQSCKIYSHRHSNVKIKSNTPEAWFWSCLWCFTANSYVVSGLLPETGCTSWLHFLSLISVIRIAHFALERFAVKKRLKTKRKYNLLQVLQVKSIKHCKWISLEHSSLHMSCIYSFLFS